MDDFTEMRISFEDTRNERDELRSRMKELEEVMSSKNQSGKMDVMFKSEIEHLKIEL